MTENVLSLKPWDAALRRAKTKTTGLLERSDLASYVPSLSPLEAYTAVKELGPSDAPGVLVHFSPEQIQTLWDLEGWHVHRLSVPDVVLWLSSFREGSLEAMQRAAANMDFEALSVLLRRRLLIASKPRDDRSDDDPLPEWLSHPSPDIEPFVETPDGRFIIAARPFDEDESIDEDVDEEDRKWVLSFVAELYQQEDWESVATVLRSALNDLTTSLEEDAYRFRSGRLEDLGFPPRERAIEIYGLLDPGPASPLAPAPVVDLPLIAPFVEPLQQGFFHAAMQSITDPAQMRRLEGDLVAVANKALVADGIAPSQTESVQEALRRLRGYIELALVEGVAPSERLPEATRRLLEDHLERLFRIGYTLTVRAGGRARRLLERPELGDGSRDLALRRLSTAEQGVVEALLLRRPRVSGALEPVVLAQQTIERSTGDEAVTFALDAGAAEIRRPFLAPADLDAVRWVLSDLENFLDAWRESPPERPALADDLNLPPEERTLDVDLATAVAAVVLGRPYAVTALTATDLADLADGLTRTPSGPVFQSEALRRVVEVAGGPRVAPRVGRVLSTLAEQLWPHVGKDTIDPRFVDSVLTRLDY